MCYSERQRDERPYFISVGQVGAAKLEVLDVHINNRVVDEKSLCVDIGFLAAIQQLVLLVVVCVKTERYPESIRVGKLEFPVAVFLFGPSSGADPVGDAGTNLAIVRALGLPLRDLRAADPHRAFAAALGSAALVVDGLTGVAMVIAPTSPAAKQSAPGMRPADEMKNSVRV